MYAHEDVYAKTATATAATARPELTIAAVLGLKLEAPLFWLDEFWLELELEPELDEAGADEELLLPLLPDEPLLEPELPELPEEEPVPEPLEEPVVAEEPLAAAEPLVLRHEVS